MDVEVPSECNGYKVVQLAVSDTIHYLYIKEHAVREVCQEKPPNRTIFILGTPPFISELNYTRLFSKFGKVENVFFHSSPCASVPPENTSKYFVDFPEVKGYKVAYVVFEKDTSVNKVMRLNSETPLLITDDNTLHTGIIKWCDDYNSKLVDVDQLQKDIDAFMAEYDSLEEEKIKREKGEMEPDDEGWVKVTKKGRRPGFARKESVRDRIMKKEDEKKQKKQLLNFYRFQIRESKMNQLVKLREKFEEDKKKISLLKQSRKFRPF